MIEWFSIGDYQPNNPTKPNQTNQTTKTKRNERRRKKTAFNFQNNKKKIQHSATEVQLSSFILSFFGYFFYLGFCVCVCIWWWNIINQKLTCRHTLYIAHLDRSELKHTHEYWILAACLARRRSFSVKKIRQLNNNKAKQSKPLSLFCYFFFFFEQQQQKKIDQNQGIH